jgi:hypothetical protein
VRYLRVVLPASALTRSFEITGFHLLFDYGLPDDGNDVYDDSEDQVGVRDHGVPAAVLRLHPAQPNPSRGSTLIRWENPDGLPVEVRVHSLSGALIRRAGNLTHGPGRGAWSWDGRDDAGRDVPAGIYFCVLRAGTKRAAEKIVLAR